MKTLALSTVAGAALLVSGAASAGEAVQLTDKQLDGVSAGQFLTIELGGFSAGEALALSTGGCGLVAPFQCSGTNTTSTSTSENSGALPGDNTGNASSFATSTWSGGPGTFSESGSGSISQSGWSLSLGGLLFGN